MHAWIHRMDMDILHHPGSPPAAGAPPPTSTPPRAPIASVAPPEKCSCPRPCPRPCPSSSDERDDVGGPRLRGREAPSQPPAGRKSCHWSQGLGFDGSGHYDVVSVTCDVAARQYEIGVFATQEGQSGRQWRPLLAHRLRGRTSEGSSHQTRRSYSLPLSRSRPPRPPPPPPQSRNITYGAIITVMP